MRPDLVTAAQRFGVGMAILFTAGLAMVALGTALKGISG